MINSKIVFFVVVCTLGVGSAADDIELFVRDVNPGGAPYMHVVLDSSATGLQALCTYGDKGSCAPPFMSKESYKHLRTGHRDGDSVTRFEVFSAVLSRLFESPAFAQLNVSLLISDKDDGARVLSAYKRLGADYAGVSGATLLAEKLAALPLDLSVAQQHNFNAKDAFYIWYRYINATDDTVPDFESCSRFFSIVMATESSVEDNLLDRDIADELGIPVQAAPTFERLLYRVHDTSSDLVTVSAKGMNYLDTTWVVSPENNANLQRDWAEAGGSRKPLNIDRPSDLERSLSIAFSKAVNAGTNIVSPWAPIASLVVDRPTGDVFASVVQPRTTLRWHGNIKKYQLGTSISDSVQDPKASQILDAQGQPAIVSNGMDKGRISSEALSFWTRVSALPIDDDPDVPIGSDGQVVTRGGAGQKLPGHIRGNGIVGDRNSDAGSRQLFIEPATSSNGIPDSLIALDVDSQPAELKLVSALEVSTIDEVGGLIRWARGQDIDDEDGDQLLSEARPWILGASLHSGPAVLNYGAVSGYSSENPRVRVFMGSGDGAFHAFENTSKDGLQSGREMFAFFPDEGLRNLKFLRDDTHAGTKMRYGVDGGVAFLTVDNNGDGNLDAAKLNADAAYVYFGMRRGGSSYYALDVSNPDEPPALQWKISRSSSIATTGDFRELGLSFSKPIVGKVKYGEEPVDVVIFAGGYHGGWDENYVSRIGKDLGSTKDVVESGASTVSTGNAIYIVNAISGELVWKSIYGPTTDTANSASNTYFRHAQMVDSIPSTVSVLKNAGGTIDRLYVGDTGGAVWRVDLPVPNAPGVNHRKEHWFVSKLAELGSTGKASDRRFFHGPDIIRSKESGGAPFDGILISSGNRADPNSTDVQDYLFYLKDYNTVSGDDAVRSRSVVGIDSAPEFAIADRTNCIKGGDLDVESGCRKPIKNGWGIRLARPGEKSLSSPLVDGGRAFFTSYVPPVYDTCTISAGGAYAYAVNLEDASGLSPEGRIFALGNGVASAVLALSDGLLLPLGGSDKAEELSCEGKLCQRHSTNLQRIYWREPGVDLQ